MFEHPFAWMNNAGYGNLALLYPDRAAFSIVPSITGSLGRIAQDGFANFPDVCFKAPVKTLPDVC